jgi:hypothetical protein
MKTAVNARRNSGKLKRFVKSFKFYFSPAKIFTREDRQFRLNWWQILCVITFGALATFALSFSSRFDISRPLLASVGSILITIKLRWRLRNRVWFWLTIAVYTILAAGLTLALTWSTNGASRPIISGVMVISTYCIFAVLNAFEIWSRRTTRPARLIR